MRADQICQLQNLFHGLKNGLITEIYIFNGTWQKNIVTGIMLSSGAVVSKLDMTGGFGLNL